MLTNSSNAYGQHARAELINNTKTTPGEGGAIVSSSNETFGTQRELTQGIIKREKKGRQMKKKAYIDPTVSRRRALTVLLTPALNRGI
jgi:hypothetical protein